MANFLLIGICLLAGILFRRSGTLPHDAHKGINAYIIYIALPAVSLKYLPHISWKPELLLPALSPVLVWLLGWCYVQIYARVRGTMSPNTLGGLKLSAGLCNTSFIGFPLIVAYFGEEALPVAVICDQVTFVLLSTVGIIAAIRSSRQQALTARLLLRRVFTFPPLLGCIAALSLPHVLPLAPLAPLFDKLAATVGPLALFSIGLQLRFNGWRGELRMIGSTLLYKLLLAPAAVLLLALLTGRSGQPAAISVFEAAMPTLLSTGIIADQYQLNPKLTNLIIGIGILLSLLTTACWYLLIRLVWG